MEKERISVPKLDLKKELRHLYLPSAKEVSVVDVPEMRFLTIDGRIEPGATPGTSRDFAEAIGALYGLAYTLKFISKLCRTNPIDYTVMALEGMWTTPTGGADFATSDEWEWTLMIVQPDHIGPEMLEEALVKIKAKREKEGGRAEKKRRGSKVSGDEGDTRGVGVVTGPTGENADKESVETGDTSGIDLSSPFDRVRLETFREGLCLQIMHIGPYADEPTTMQKLTAFAQEHGYKFHGRHHEIYLGDPRTAKPENLRTVLRHPVFRERASVG